MRSIRAVAINTVRQLLRIKIAAAFVVLLLVLLASMASVMTGDGTIKGRLQTFLSYGMSLTSFLLSVFTVTASVYTFTSDLKDKQIYTVLTKPVSRLQLIVGKFIGVTTVGAGLLVLFSLIIYTITIYTPRFAGVTEQQALQLDNEFFTARASLVPQEPDVSKEAQAAYEKLERDGLIKPGFVRSRVLAEISERLKMSRQAAAPGREVVWEFENVRIKGAEQKLFIKYKYDVSVNPPDLQVQGKWAIGDFRQAQMETPVYTFERKDLIRTSYEIEVPADCIAEDGFVGVAFFNDPQLNRTVVIFSPEDGLEILYKADTFTANYARGVLLIFFRLVFLAALGTAASAFLSFPVAILLCTAVFFVGLISGFATESFAVMEEGLREVYSYTFALLIKLLPQFDKFSPSQLMVSARLVTWSLVGMAALLLVGVQSVLLLIFSWIVFARREIAKVIV